MPFTKHLLGAKAEESDPQILSNYSQHLHSADPRARSALSTSCIQTAQILMTQGEKRCP